MDWEYETDRKQTHSEFGGKIHRKGRILKQKGAGDYLEDKHFAGELP
jgi:hypothetical protein